MVKTQRTAGGLGRVNDLLDGNGLIDYARVLKMQTEKRISKALKKDEKAYNKKKVSKNVDAEQLSLFNDMDLFMMVKI